MHNRVILFSLSLFLVWINCSAGPQEKMPIKDTAQIEIYLPKKETEEKVFSESRYNYDEKEVKRSRNFIKEFWDWLTGKDKKKKSEVDELLAKKKGDKNGKIDTFWSTDNVSNIMILFSVLIIISVFIYLLVTGKIKKIFAAKPAEVPFDFKEMHENIEQLNIDQLIQQAIDSDNFRLATRWAYLKILKSLTVKNIIVWKPFKTNHDYYAELSGTPYKDDFIFTSKIYERVWYGEFSVNEEQFKGFMPSFNKISSANDV
jgi:hypothetical protein